MKAEAWKRKRAYSETEKTLALSILEELKQGTDLNTAQRAHPKPEGGGFIPKHALVAAYYQMVDSGEWKADESLLQKSSDETHASPFPA